AGTAATRTAARVGGHRVARGTARRTRRGSFRPLIYVDTSVVFAQLLSEDDRPSPALWESTLVASRLVEYETWTKVNGDGLARSHGEAVRSLLGRISFLELSPIVLERALEPFPVRLRTLDALHIASLLFLRSRRVAVELATYDGRMIAAAKRLGVPLYELS